MSWRRLRQLDFLGRHLFLRDFNYRYRQTFFGYFWAVLKPMMLGASVILFGSQFESKGAEEPVPFAAFSFVGLLLLRIFWDSVIQPQWVTRRMRGMFRRGPFPHGAVLFASVYYVLVDASVYLILATVLLITTGAPVAWTAAFTLLAVPIIMAAGLALGVYLAPITLVYMDARYSLPAMFPGILLTVPVLYRPLDSGPLAWVNAWNPLTYVVGLPRDLLFGLGEGQLFGFVVALALFAVIGSRGLRFFHRGMKVAIDQV
ncbi:MAG: hypothetical protein KDC38_16130 [Planctomycetes bacterium]|nr:hypothetical protein [Planctomycetota bacterium]